MASSSFKLYMFDEDFKRIKAWVLQYPELETGGSLFGLWTSGCNPVARIVLGPGKGSKRTGVSFYQDISYLERLGNLLTQDYMLCHIGEWHSHHRLTLYEPSAGDVSTVVRNYPEGVCGFVLMIANIISEKDVFLSPYMFTEDSRSRRANPRFKSGEIEILKGDSPFRTVETIHTNIHCGEEVLKSGHHYPSTPRTVTISSANKYPPDHAHSNLGNSNEPRFSQNNAPEIVLGQKGLVARRVELHQDVKGDGQETTTEPMDTSIPNPSDGKSDVNMENAKLPVPGDDSKGQLPAYYDEKNVLTPVKGTTRDTEAHASPKREGETPSNRSQVGVVQTAYKGGTCYVVHSASATMNTPNTHKGNISEGAVNLGFVEQNSSSQPARPTPMTPTEKVLPIPWVDPLTNRRQWYHSDKGEKDLKTIHHSLCLIADELNVVMSRNSNTHDMTVSFLHHGTKWMIEFPPNFPRSVTKLKLEEEYSTATGRYFNKTALVFENEEVAEMLTKVKDKVITSCNKCNPSRRTAEANSSQRTQSHWK